MKKRAVSLVAGLALLVLPSVANAQAGAYRDQPAIRKQLQEARPPQLVRLIHWDLILALPDCAWSDYYLISLLLRAARVACAAIVDDNKVLEECFGGRPNADPRHAPEWDRLAARLREGERSPEAVVQATVRYVGGVLPREEVDAANASEDSVEAYRAVVRRWRATPMCRPRPSQDLISR